MIALVVLLVGACKAKDPPLPLDLGVTLTTNGSVAASYKACDKDGGFVTAVSLYQSGVKAGRRDDKLLWQIQAEASPLLLRDFVLGREPVGYETLQPLVLLPESAKLVLHVDTSEKQPASVLTFSVSDLDAENYLLANKQQVSREAFKGLDPCATRASSEG